MEKSFTPNPFIQPQEEEEIDFKRYFYLLLNRWYWLVAFLLLGIVAAWFYSRINHENFLVDTKIIVPENRGGVDLAMFFETSLAGGKKASIINEMELLKSYTMNQRALEQLGWKTKWDKKNFLRWDGLYSKEPIEVETPAGAVNAESIYVTIEPLGNNQYKAEASGQAILKAGGAEVDVSFASTGTFGEPLKNDFFHFILHKNGKVLEPGEEYRFRFINQNQAIRNYVQRINVSQTEKQSEVIRVSLEGHEVLRDVDYLNQLIGEYLDMKLEQETEIQQRSLVFVENQLKLMHDSLESVSMKFTEFRANNVVLDISAQGALVLGQLAELESGIAQQSTELDYFSNLISYIEDNKTIDELTAPSVLGIEDPVLNGLVMQLSEAYNRKKMLSLSAHDASPVVNRLDSEINQIKRQLGATLRNLINNTKASIRQLENRYAKINGQLKDLPGKEQQLINISRQYDLTNEIYTFLLQKRAELEITLASAVVDAQIIDPARSENATRKVTPMLFLLLIGAVAGIMIPVVIILLMDAIDSKIHLQEDVERLTTLSIVGNVLHSHLKDERVVSNNPLEPISESFRTIRTNIQYKFTSRKDGRIISIHSITPGEGKTFISVNLATILALNKKKVLLIGADMRKPRLEEVYHFSTNSEAGLSTYLIGKYTYEEVTRDTETENLKVITSGAIPPNPSELLENKQFEQLIEKARSDYDYIVIDNAPVSMVTDGYITGRYSELNIFVLRNGVSHKNELKFINDVASKEVIKNIAIVINDVKVNRLTSGYSYNYSYSKGYRK